MYDPTTAAYIDGIMTGLMVGMVPYIVLVWGLGLARGRRIDAEDDKRSNVDTQKEYEYVTYVEGENK